MSKVNFLVVTPCETYPLVDTLSTGSMKYSSNPSKHRLEYAPLSKLSIYASLYDFVKRNKSANQSYISFYESNHNIEL